jgi:RNA polymerase sigma factor (sigma-70 family)
MADPDIAERLAKILHLPVGVVRGYGKPRTWVAARRVRKSRLALEKQRVPATIKDGGETGAVAPHKEYKEEDELYERWRLAPIDEKPEIEKQQFGVVLKHAKKVIRQMVPEADDHLAREIASQVIERLAKFRQESKFSTWSHKIILNQSNLYLRRRIPERERFYVSPGKPEEDINLADPRAEAAFDRVEEALDLQPVERLTRTLPKKDYVLLQCILAEMTMAEAAKKLGDSEDAAESRWRRLKTRLKKKLRGKSDGK